MLLTRKQVMAAGTEADHYWWQYWRPKVHPKLRVTDSNHAEFDVDEMLWDHGVTFSAFFEALGVAGKDLRLLLEAPVVKFDVRAEGGDTFVDTVGRPCLAKTAYHPGDADSVKQVLERIVGDRVEVEPYVNGPKPYVWVFRFA